MKEEIKVLEKAEGNMTMINSIKIGDPLYFEEGGNGLKYTYCKSFRQKKDWQCSLEVCNNLITYPPDDYFKDGFQCNEIRFKAYFAYDETMLSLLKNNQMYTRQTEKTTPLCVDTASYIIAVNGKEELIHIGADGWIGQVVEYNTKNKLEAITIELALSDDSDYMFESAKETLEYLFNCKLTDVNN